MPIPGEEGLHCSLQRSMEWSSKAASGDGSMHLDEVEHDFGIWMFPAARWAPIAVEVVASGLCSHFVPVGGMTRREAQQQ